ncbi:MAG: cytochrome c [Acidimicrobiia bacterium]|nr:cytochrome c [Acidimicrobiia bacterium]
MRRLLAALIALALVAACGSDVPADADGATIYELVCAHCHGADLEGSGLGPALVGAEARSTELPESYFTQAVSRGIGSMPSYGGTLSDAQIERVVAFILEAQGR